VLTSTNGGKTWSTNSPPVNDGFNAIASSADGKTLIVASGPNTGALFSSTNAGLSWTSNNLPKTHWGSVAASADGKTFAATTTPGYIYVSTNAGAFWWISGVPYTNWGAIAISADGTKIAACTDENYDGMVYTSTNSGLTWQSELVLPLPPFKLVSSADGARLFFSSRGEIAMLQTTPTPQLDTTLVNHRISLSWIIPSEPFVLQQALNLSPPQWTDVTNSPVLIFTNLHSQVTMPATNPASYYRLRSQ
jgi:photosystem II stability/assembly factor-like uncharacterized protein